MGLVLEVLVLYKWLATRLTLKVGISLEISISILFEEKKKDLNIFDAYVALLSEDFFFRLNKIMYLSDLYSHQISMV